MTFNETKEMLIKEGLFAEDGMIKRMSELTLPNRGSLPDYEKMQKKLEEDFDACYKDIDNILKGDN